MPQRTALWTVASSPEPLSEARLPSEQLLEQMIVAAPRILSDEWMLIGRQEPTVTGRLDLLGLAPDGTLVLIELKRERTPREVVAQALDYAAWVERLGADEIVAIYGRFAPGRDLAADCVARFGQPLDEDTLNYRHQIVIVATQLDDSSERIVKYLGDKGIAINVLCFQVFAAGAQQLLSRTWLMDPVQSQVGTATSTPKVRRERELWNQEFYACFGHGSARDWDEGRKYGFICAGGGSWYSNTLSLLSAGDRVWVKAPGYGFVGVGEVIGPREGITDFALPTTQGERPAAEILSGGTYHREDSDDPERMEYFVPVRWLHAVPLSDAVDEIGMFGNQNTVCKPTTPKWRTTVERLKERWSIN
jgi:hypothetical protein